MRGRWNFWRSKERPSDVADLILAGTGLAIYDPQSSLSFDGY
jgi:hypothetical protein